MHKPKIVAPSIISLHKGPSERIRLLHQFVALFPIIRNDPCVTLSSYLASYSSLTSSGKFELYATQTIPPSDSMLHLFRDYAFKPLRVCSLSYESLPRGVFSGEKLSRELLLFSIMYVYTSSSCASQSMVHIYIVEKLKIQCYCWRGRNAMVIFKETGLNRR